MSSRNKLEINLYNTADNDNNKNNKNRDNSKRNKDINFSINKVNIDNETPDDFNKSGYEIKTLKGGVSQLKNVQPHNRKIGPSYNISTPKNKGLSFKENLITKSLNIKDQKLEKEDVLNRSSLYQSIKDIKEVSISLVKKDSNSNGKNAINLKENIPSKHLSSTTQYRTIQNDDNTPQFEKTCITPINNKAKVSSVMNIHNINYNIYNMNTNNYSNVFSPFTSHTINPKTEATVNANISKIDLNGLQKTIKSEKLGKFNLLDYLTIEELDNCAFGKQVLVKDKLTEKKHHLIKMLITGNKNLESIFSYFENAHKYQYESIQKIFALNITVVDNYSYCLSILSEPYEFTLEGNISLMKEMKEHYLESDLLIFLKQIVLALVYLKSKNLCHGYINPSSIYLMNILNFEAETDRDGKKDEIIAKLSLPFLDDPLKWRYSLPHLIKECLHKNELFLSPLLHSNITRNLYTRTHDPVKSDIYSLGLCILYAATFSQKPSIELISKYTHEDVRKVVNKYMQMQYSSQFIELVSSMLYLDEKKRVTHQKILTSIDLLLKRYNKA